MSSIVDNKLEELMLIKMSIKKYNQIFLLYIAFVLFPILYSNCLNLSMPSHFETIWNNL